MRTTVEIPAVLHDRLRVRSEKSGTSVRALIVRAIDQVYSESGKEMRVTGPLVRGSGRLGPSFPEDENLHDLVFS